MTIEELHMCFNDCWTASPKKNYFLDDWAASIYLLFSCTRYVTLKKNIWIRTRRDATLQFGGRHVSEITITLSHKQAKELIKRLDRNNTNERRWMAYEARFLILQITVTQFCSKDYFIQSVRLLFLSRLMSTINSKFKHSEPFFALKIIKEWLTVDLYMWSLLSLIARNLERKGTMLESKLVNTWLASCR